MNVHTKPTEFEKGRAAIEYSLLHDALAGEVLANLWECGNEPFALKLCGGKRSVMEARIDLSTELLTMVRCGYGIGDALAVLRETGWFDRVLQAEQGEDRRMQ